jgi:uncharacterized protein (DUF488 family)
MAEFATIGVYGFDGASFIRALEEAQVALVLDVRQRRGVRGSQYAWANAKRLQAALAEAGIGYSHLPELAPTTEMRHLQYEEDARKGEGKRSRTKLAPEYVQRYTDEVLDQVDLDPIVRFVGDNRAALLCVERDAEACHRSLVAERLERDFGLPVRHLKPSRSDCGGPAALATPSGSAAPRCHLPAVPCRGAPP